MCIATIRKVKHVDGNIALMDDGRKVRLGPEVRLNPGEYAEVYADIVIRKLEDSEVKDLQSII